MTQNSWKEEKTKGKFFFLLFLQWFEYFFSSYLLLCLNDTTLYFKLKNKQFLFEWCNDERNDVLPVVSRTGRSPPKPNLWVWQARHSWKRWPRCFVVPVVEFLQSGPLLEVKTDETEELGFDEPKVRQAESNCGMRVRVPIRNCYGNKKKLFFYLFR